MGPTRGFIFTNANYDQEQIKASSRLAHDEANKRPDFVFINFDGNAGEKRKKDTRRMVRSRATAYSHRVAPRGLSKPETTPNTSQSSESDISSRRTSSISTLSSASSISSPNGQLRKRARPSPLHVQTSPKSGMANISRKRTKFRRSREVSPFSGSSDRSLSPGPFEFVLPDPTYMDASLRDPFGTYPVHYRNWYGQLMQYWYNVVFMRGTRVIKASQSELGQYTIWSRQQEMAEPALFYTSLFLASGIPVAEGYFPLKAALWLRWKTVEAMKKAIADPKRSMSTPVILAVGRIALHEHIYGNRKLAHEIHRPAQKRMIDMRGGLANMDIPDTVKQLIVWTDALLSAEVGSEPYFANVPKQIAIKSYTAQEAVHVTNYCSPKRNTHPGYDKGDVQPAEPE